MAKDLVEQVKETSALLNTEVKALCDLLTKDFAAAAIGNSDLLMATVRGMAHEKLDAICDL